MLQWINAVCSLLSCTQSNTHCKTFAILSVCILIFSVYPTSLLPSNGQSTNWKRYDDPGRKFSFLHPPNWVATTRHEDTTGFTEVTLSDPNSTRTKVLVIYTPNDASLDSNSGKPILASRALTSIEQEISEDYFFFNSTGKFPHKYSIQGYESASDLIDHEKIKGRPGKMLLVFAKVTNDDSILFIYSESKRLFYKNLANVSQIIKSFTI